MKSMLAAIIAIITTALILAIDPQEQIINTVLEASNKCINKTGVSMSDLMQLSMMKIPENNKTICYVSCTAKSLGFITADNKINKEKITNTLNIFKDYLNKLNIYDKVIKVVNTCIDEVPSNATSECDIAKYGMECVIENGKKENIFNNLRRK